MGQDKTDETLKNQLKDYEEALQKIESKDPSAHLTKLHMIGKMKTIAREVLNKYKPRENL